MVLEITDADLVISMKDTRHYTAPCTLDSFLTTWKAPAQKSIFPYQKFSSIEECEATTEFPPIEDFFNDLKQVIFLFLTGFNHFARHLVIKTRTIKQRMNIIAGRIFPTNIRKRCTI